MIQSLHISGYRGFADFAVDGLSRVNLIVGKNNAGKTALLEAVHLACAKGDPNVLIQAAARRGEMILGETFLPESNHFRPLIESSHLFAGHKIDSESQFAVSADDALFTVAVSENLDTKEPSDYVRFLDGFTGSASEGKEPTYSVPMTQDGGVSVHQVRVIRRRRFSANGSKVDGDSPTMFIPTSLLSARDLSSLWTEVQLQGAEQVVVDALKVIEPDLRSIVFLASSARGFGAESGPGILVDMGRDRGRIPLGSLGEGMKRMLILATAIVAAAGGTLIVDEIDTGLHYSTLSRVWELVTAAAIANDVQVFATTHSADCVRGMEMLCSARPELQPEVALHKIVAGQRKSLRLGGDKLALALEGDLEVR